MAQSRIRWGILGAGSPNGLAIAQAIEASATGALVAVADKEENARKFANNFDDSKVKAGAEGVSVYFKFEQLLSSKAVDAIYIALPIKHNDEWIVKAIQAKKHVLFEPPSDISLEKMHKIINAAKTAGNIFCMEAMMYRAHPFYEEIKNIIVTDKKLGDIRFYNAIYTTGSTSDDHRRDGSIFNEGCYPLSLIRHLVNEEPISMEATGTMFTGTREDSEATLIMRFPNNTKATIQTANNAVMSWQFHVIGTKGSLSIMSNPWFPGNRSTIHLTLYDRFQPNFPSPREEIMGYYSDKPLRSYTIDVLGQCVLIKGLTGNAVSLDHTLGNIKILEEWREKVAAKQPQLEKPLHQSSLTNTSATHFKQKPPEEKDQGKKLFVPSRRNGNSNN